VVGSAVAVLSKSAKALRFACVCVHCVAAACGGTHSSPPSCFPLPFRLCSGSPKVGTWEHGNMGTWGHGNGGGGAAPGRWSGPGERDASTTDSRTACLERPALVRSRTGS
jgi:hypothetical protein